MPRIHLLASVLLAASAMAQSGPIGTEPSPFEAFAAAPEAHIVWSGEATRLSSGSTAALIAGLSVEKGAQKMKGVTVDLSEGEASDRIYLDEEATQRTITALGEILDGVARFGVHGNGCEGAKEFWPLYDWPWNKYHELNVDFCNGDQLVLSPRGKEMRFAFSGKDPSSLAAILSDALAELKQH
jgi:hypothetical protein